MAQNQNYQNKGGFSRRGYDSPKENAIDVYNRLSFDSKWITNVIDKSLISFADNAGEYMAKNGLTNSKIRSIYGEIKRIQMGAFENEKASFFLLKPKLAYALGRDPKNQGLILFKKIFDSGHEAVSDSKSFLNFCNLLEAILAYHKSYGGKD